MLVEGLLLGIYDCSCDTSAVSFIHNDLPLR